VVRIEFADPYAKTFENSDDGDITKLSFELDHEMRCWILWSSSILLQCQQDRK